jgi:hypothetical protein
MDIVDIFLALQDKNGQYLEPLEKEDFRLMFLVLWDDWVDNDG